MMWTTLGLLAQNDIEPVSTVATVIGGIIYLGVIVLLIASQWIIFTKAGKPGWAALIPIYNLIVLLEIIGKPLWWVVLMLIPCVNFIVAVLLFIGLAKSFGKSEAYGIGLALLAPIFFPMLAFGDAKYRGPAGE